MHLSIEEASSGTWTVSFVDEVLFFCDKRFFSYKTLIGLSSETKEEFLAAFFLFEYKKSLRFVLVKLAKRALHSQKIDNMLKERLIHAKTRKKVIERLDELYMLDDSAYICSFVQSNIRRGKSFIQIIEKAKRNMLPIDQIKQVMQNNVDLSKESLKKLIKQKFPALFLPNQDKNTTYKAKRRLCMRGFSFGVIETATRELKEER